MRLTLCFIVSLVTAVLCFFVGIRAQTEGHPDTHPKTYSERIKSEVPLKADFNNDILDLRDLFDIKYAYYQEQVANLKSIQFNILILIVAGLLIIVFKTRNIKIPWFDTEVPNGLLYLLLFLGGIYTWVNFGLTLNTVVDTRLALHNIVLELERTSSNTVTYVYSLEHVLSDSNFIDNFCIHYFEIFENNGWDGSKKGLVEALTYFGLYGIYAYILGLFVATTLVSTTEYIRIKNINKGVARLMMTFGFIMLLLSSVVFLVKMPFIGVWVGAIWLWATIGIGVWKWHWYTLVDKRYNTTK